MQLPLLLFALTLIFSFPLTNTAAASGCPGVAFDSRGRIPKQEIALPRLGSACIATVRASSRLANACLVVEEKVECELGFGCSVEGVTATVTGDGGTACVVFSTLDGSGESELRSRCKNDDGKTRLRLDVEGCTARPLFGRPASPTPGAVLFVNSKKTVMPKLLADSRYNGIGVISEFTPSERATFGKTYTIGMTCGFPNAQPLEPWWPNTPFPGATAKARAESVIKVGLQYPSEYPQATEDIIYSQDLAYLSKDPGAGYAQAAALMWVASVKLANPSPQPGRAVPTWPNLGSALVASLNYDATDLQNKMTVALPSDTAQWDFTPDTFPGFLIANDLVDGIIAQEYNKPGTLPVPLPSGVQYVLQSSTENQFLPLPTTSDFCTPAAFPWTKSVYIPADALTEASPPAIQAIGTPRVCP
ncbi:MAG: hypothetical protein VX546_05020 [Myxococcota bacterium]|nr:hypothetical protein [Myxococcota bacterium]